MSVKHRRILLGVTVAVWAVWLAAEYVRALPGVVSPGHEVGTIALRLASVVAAVSVVIAHLVSPILATARIWYDIGKRAQAETCTCDQAELARVNADVIPFRPTIRRR